MENKKVFIDLSEEIRKVDWDTLIDGVNRYVWYEIYYSVGLFSLNDARFTESKFPFIREIVQEINSDEYE